jgi:hypothetical protein
VLINYSVGKKRFEKKPDEGDLDLIERIERGTDSVLVPDG